MKFYIIPTLLITLQLSAYASEMTMEERRQSVVIMQDQIEQREARLAKVMEDLQEQGDAIDARIGYMIDSLSKLKDSENSKTRISQVKRDAAGRLMNMVKFYQAERRKLVERAKKDGDASLEGIASDVERIDKMTQKRTDQIVQLVKSIPGEEDIEKYEKETSYYSYGWIGETTRISDEWRQNRLDKTQATKARRDATQALEKTIKDIEKRRNAIKAQIDQGRLNGVELEIQTHELNYLNELYDVRKKQLLEVTKPQDADGSAVSRNDAMDIQDLYESETDELRKDFNDAIRIYRRAVVERDNIHQLNENLKARIEWLEENDPDWKN